MSKEQKRGSSKVTTEIFTGNIQELPASHQLLNQFMQYVDEVVKPEGSPSFEQWRSQKISASQNEFEMTWEREHQADEEARKRILEYINDFFVWVDSEGKEHGMKERVFKGGPACLELLAEGGGQSRRIIDGGIRFVRRNDMKGLSDWLTTLLPQGETVGSNFWYETQIVEDDRGRKRLQDWAFKIKRK